MLAGLFAFFVVFPIVGLVIVGMFGDAGRVETANRQIPKIASATSSAAKDLNEGASPARSVDAKLPEKTVADTPPADDSAKEKSAVVQGIEPSGDSGGTIAPLPQSEAPPASLPQTRTTSKPETEPVRLWTDSSGKFKINAKLLRVADGNVELQKDDGSVVKVPITRLSEADRRYVELNHPTR
jgi:hypothetical protein